MLYTILKNTADQYPNKTAVICNQSQFTYAEFQKRVDRLAADWNSLGIRKDDKIAVIHKNCHLFLESYFASARIGAVLVPINHRLTPQDYAYILNDSQAKILITGAEFVPHLEKLRDRLPVPKLMILGDSDKDIPLSERNLTDEGLLQKQAFNIPQPSKIKDSDIAQIYYTSGTTGKPKGVILTHKNNQEHVIRSIQELQLSSTDRWLHISPMFHLADAWAVWSITQVAGTHVMMPDFEPRAVLETIENQQITLSNFIPTMLNLMVNHPEVDRFDFSSLRVILTGGAPIAKEVIRKVITTFGCDYIQTYGLTETSPFLTMSILKEHMKGLPFEERLKYMATTGRPFAGIELRVVKKDGTEVKSDESEVGEIIAKGVTVTPGYWRLPEETSRRIVGGWLHTKDLAVVNPEGYVTIVDRKDDMIITGGENVYSIEVEDALYAHPGILEAAVIGLPDPIWGERVTAVVVPKPGSDLCEEDVITFCRKRLAPFKVPKKVFLTKTLPKTGSAKICKYKLRENLKENLNDGCD